VTAIVSVRGSRKTFEKANGGERRIEEYQSASKKRRGPELWNGERWEAGRSSAH